jgi:pimeloyl-ACP methyl ester carboxylesterase
VDPTGGDGPLTRRAAIKTVICWGAGAYLAPLLSACDPDVTVPPVGWHPNVLQPVFYGHQDFDAAAGAPGRLRMFYPSTEGSPRDGPFLEGSVRYPLVLFLHGQCRHADHFREWFVLPAQLARSAFVVAVPDLAATRGGTYPWSDSHPDLTLAEQVLGWVRTRWVHHARVASEPSTAIIGHSYGALLAARIATSRPLAAYASLSGVWAEWPSPPRRPIRDLAMPSLFTWGTADDPGENSAVLGGELFDSVPRPKHRVVFAGGHHWDYLRPNRTSCGETTGPCRLVGSLSADFACLFLSKYLPPRGLSGGAIPDDLSLPTVNLTNEQQFFAGAHLTGLRTIARPPRDGEEPAHGCRVTVSWFTPQRHGTRNLPN